MASNTSNKLKKPMLLIKRESIFLPSRPIIVNTAMKRPLCSVAVSEPKKTDSRSDKHSEPHITIRPKLTPDTTKAFNQEIIIPNDLQETHKKDSIANQLLKKLLDNKCCKHDVLPEYQVEGLPQNGDIFKSPEDFLEYANNHAKDWFFYYTQFNSANVMNQPTFNKNYGTSYTYKCRMHKKTKSQSKGLRKLKASIVTDCPAGLTLKRVRGDVLFKVQDVCHHHSHELSAEIFSHHGHIIPREIKEEIKDLARFNVDIALTRRYIESKMEVPGMNLTKTVYNHYKKIKDTSTNEVLPPEKIREMLEKIKHIKATFDIPLKIKKRQIRSPRKSQKKSSKDMHFNHAEELSILEDVEDRVKVIMCEQEMAQGLLGLQDSESESQWQHTAKACDSVENEAEYEKTSQATDDDAVDALTDDNETDAGTDIEEEQYSPQIATDHSITCHEQSTSEHKTNNTTDPLITKTVFIQTKTKTTAVKKYVEQNSSIFESEQDGIAQNAIHETEPPENGQTETAELDLTQGIDPLNITKVMQTYQIGGITVETLETVDNSDTTDSQNKKARKQKQKKPQGIDFKTACLSGEIRCRKRHSELPEHNVEGLVYVGDTFSSIDLFTRYATRNAVNWHFYYFVHDSRNVEKSANFDFNRTTWYNFACRFGKGRNKSQDTGIRKVKQKTVTCPATVSIRRQPGQDLYVVTYACHHHSHELSAELFSKESHGYRLPPQLKDEIKELAWYQLDSKRIRLYLLEKTGFDLRRTIKNTLAKMRREKEKITVTPEREKEILETIEFIRANTLVGKRAQTKDKKQTNVEPVKDEESEEETEDEEIGSRVEARLSNLMYDRELIQSVRELQKSTGCDIRINAGGEVNIVTGISDLQDGLVQDVEYSNYQLDDDNDDGQIEIDPEVYNMDEIEEYVIPDENGSNEYYEGSTNEFDQNMTYIQHFQADDTNISEVGNNIVIQDIRSMQNGTQFTEVDINPVLDIEFVQNRTNVSEVSHNTYLQDIQPVQDETNTYEEGDDIEMNGVRVKDVTFISEAGTDVDNQNIHSAPPLQNQIEQDLKFEDGNTIEDEIYEYEEEPHSDSEYAATSETNISNLHADCKIEENVGESYHRNNYEASYEYSENEEDYQLMYQYTNDEECHEIEGKETCNSRDKGVQADFEAINLERDYEAIEKLETEFLSRNFGEIVHSASTRGRPIVSLEEGIINRYNIEFYINLGGIATCIENLADNMNLSVLDLLKHVYQGEAVLKMTSGRSGKQNRRTVHLTFVPLTMAFPFEKFKYINGLQEYKAMCSKYSNVVYNLENTIANLSAELTTAKEKQNVAKNMCAELQILKEKCNKAESENKRLQEIAENYQNLLNGNTLKEQLLKKCQEDLAQAQALNVLMSHDHKDLETAQAHNKELLSRIKHLENLYKGKDAEIIQPVADKQEVNKLLRQHIKDLDQNLRLSERVAALEQTLETSNVETVRYKHKIKKLEELYLSNGQTLLDKIKDLETQLCSAKTELMLLKKTENPLESENNRLRQEIRDLEDNETSDNIRIVEKINRLEDVVSQRLVYDERRAKKRKFGLNIR